MKLDTKEICIKCGAKCCFLGGPSFTKKEREKILKAGFKDIFIFSGKYYDLKAKNDKCPFLKNKLCLIHSIKPIVCKIWPVYPIFKENKRKFIILCCPLSKDLSKKEIKMLKKLAEKIPKGLAVYSISDLSPKTIRRLNKFGWSK